MERRKQSLYDLLEEEQRAAILEQDRTLAAAKVRDIADEADHATPIAAHAADDNAHHDPITIGADAAHSLATQVLSAVLAGAAQTGHISAAAQSIAGLKTFLDGLKTDTVGEETAATGVTIDSLLIKDGAHGQIGGTSDLHTEYQKESEKGAASGYASLGAGTTVVENPANAQTTAAASKIPISGANAKLDKNWIMDIEIHPIPASDHTASGIYIPFTAGENLVFGNACYYKSDEKMWKGQADATPTPSVIGLALETKSAEAACAFLLYGIARDDTWAWTVGGLIYLSDGTAGALTQTAPADTDELIQIVGVATHADRMFWNPQLVVVKHNA